MKMAKVVAASDQELTAYPTHSRDSPKKLAPETNSNIPPENEHNWSWISDWCSLHIEKTSGNLVSCFTRLPQVSQYII